MDKANVNVVFGNIEDRAMNSITWDPNLCNNLEDMLPNNISEDQKEKTLALLDSYVDVIVNSDNLVNEIKLCYYASMDSVYITCTNRYYNDND